MGYFQVRYNSRVAIYKHKMFITLATGGGFFIWNALAVWSTCLQKYEKVFATLIWKASEWLRTKVSFRCSEISCFVYCSNLEKIWCSAFSQHKIMSKDCFMNDFANFATKLYHKKLSQDKYSLVEILCTQQFSPILSSNLQPTS